MAMDTLGRLFIADYTANAIHVVNRTTGAVTTLVGPPTVGVPPDLAFGPDGQLYVIDRMTPSILRVDPSTGAATSLATGSGDWTSGGGIAVARDGTIYFTDQDDEVFQFKPGGGAPTELVDDPLFQGAEGLVLSPDDRFLFVAAASGATQRIMRIDLRTGAFSTFATVDSLLAAALLPSGEFLTSNPTVPEKIERVSRDGLTVTDFSTDADFVFPHDIVVEPAKCGGRFPSVVGTSARDVLRGSRFADVISTLGGKDVVKGLGGKDVICGGKGRDRLVGGAANDTLLGGPGPDRLLGGKGTDKLRGGPGRDRQRQ
jgi:sugar lactone lactonase YvrE